MMDRHDRAKRLIGPIAAAGWVAVLAVVYMHTAVAAPPPDNVLLAPHRAVYELTLGKSRGDRKIDGLSGRIVYDFSGSACEGYALQFRQISELDAGEGQAVTSDLRSSSWEAGDAKSFRFSSENRTSERDTDAVDGRAERNATKLSVNLTKPTAKDFTLPATAAFPIEHMRRIIAAARGGQTIMEFPVYDGSETGDKLFNTLTVIGRPIAPGGKPTTDATAKVAQLAAQKRWPVTISYFDHRSDEEAQTGEQTPIYSISFELYENGISRALKLEYPDFTISGEMTSLEMNKEKACP